MRQQVDEWRSSSQANEEHYRQLVRVWEATEGAADRNPVGAPPAARMIAAQAARRRVVSQIPRFAVAAVLTLALVGAGWVSLRWLDRPVMTVAAAGDQTVTLPDGSFVRLADGSRLEYRTRAGERLVELTGRAFFAVASDSSRPFHVRAGDARVTVLGTRFDVMPRGDSVRVAVTEGLVALARHDAMRRLPAGTVGIAHQRGVSIDSSLSAIAAIDWPRSFFLFQDTPVTDAIGEINARMGRRVIVADSGIADRMVTAQFADEPFEDIMSTICVIVNAQCTDVDGAVRMSQ
jgi:transmembrane sensor